MTVAHATCHSEPHSSSRGSRHLPSAAFPGSPVLSPWPDFSGVRAALASPAMVLACPHGPWVQHGTPWRHTASNQGPAPLLPAQRPQASLVTSLTKGCSETVTGAIRQGAGFSAHVVSCSPPSPEHLSLGHPPRPRSSVPPSSRKPSWTCQLALFPCRPSKDLLLLSSLSFLSVWLCPMPLFTAEEQVAGQALSPSPTLHPCFSCPCGGLPSHLPMLPSTPGSNV